MDERDFRRVTEAMGRLQGEASTQIIMLFRTTWAALAEKGVLDESDVIRILDTAAAGIAEGANRNIIAGLRMGFRPSGKKGR